jgi:hypothetical protein
VVGEILEDAWVVGGNLDGVLLGFWSSEQFWIMTDDNVITNWGVWIWTARYGCNMKFLYLLE